MFFDLSYHGQGQVFGHDVVIGFLGHDDSRRRFIDGGVQRFEQSRADAAPERRIGRHGILGLALLLSGFLPAAVDAFGNSFDASLDLPRARFPLAGRERTQGHHALGQVAPLGQHAAFFLGHSPGIASLGGGQTPTCDSTQPASVARFFQVSIMDRQGEHLVVASQDDSVACKDSPPHPGQARPSHQWPIRLFPKGLAISPLLLHCPAQHHCQHDREAERTHTQSPPRVNHGNRFGHVEFVPVRHGNSSTDNGNATRQRRGVFARRECSPSLPTGSTDQRCEVGGDIRA